MADERTPLNSEGVALLMDALGDDSPARQVRRGLEVCLSELTPFDVAWPLVSRRVLAQNRGTSDGWAQVFRDLRPVWESTYTAELEARMAAARGASPVPKGTRVTPPRRVAA